MDENKFAKRLLVPVHRKTGGKEIDHTKDGKTHSDLNPTVITV
jgi:hypothetical protein